MAASASAVAGGTVAVVLDAGASTSQPQPQQGGQQPGQQHVPSQHVQGSDSDRPADERLVLRLVPRKKKQKKAVSWTDDTVDNEGMGKKSSKKCCIFHANRPFGEWDDSDDSDSECRPDSPDSGDGPPGQGGGGMPDGSGKAGPS